MYSAIFDPVMGQSVNPGYENKRILLSLKETSPFGVNSGTFIYANDMFAATLSHILSAGNSGEIAHYFGTLCSYLLKSKIDSTQINCLVLNIVRVVTSVSINKEINIKKLRLLFEDMPGLGMSAEDAADYLTNRVFELAIEICDTVAAKNRFINNIIRYIQKEFDKYSFSIQMIADEFNMTVSCLCQTFKCKTGETIGSFIWRLRLDMAKKLLAETELPLYEIIERIGYIDVSSFSRKFKKDVGVSPGTYRLKSKSAICMR